MKTIAAFLALVSALIFVPSLSSPAQAQPCQWNYTFVNGVATATYCGSVVTQGGIIIPNVNTVSNIAQLEALTIPAIAQGAVWTVLGYHTSNDGGGGQFVLASGACNNAGVGDGGTQFPSTITGTCWTRLGITNLLSLQWFGSYGDDSHDDTTAVQNLENAAYNLQRDAFYPAGIYKISAQIQMQPGVIHRGVGNSFQNSTGPITEIDATSLPSASWCYDLEMPNGTTGYQAPSFYEMYLNGCTNGIRYNNPAHGFTDDGTSQEPLSNGVIDHVTFTGEGTTGYAIQASKTFYMKFTYDTIVGGAYNTLIDLEGSDFPNISYGNLEGGQTSTITLNSHNTFGNLAYINNNFMAQLANSGTQIIDGYRTSYIEDNNFEDTSLAACVSLTGGFNAVIRNNAIDCGNSPILTVTDTSNGSSGSGYVLINASNNTANGTIISSSLEPIFNGGNGIAYFANTSGGRRKIIHNGNCDSSCDINWPFNSIASSIDSIQFMPSTSAYYSCSTDGLDNIGFGLTVNCKNGAFSLSLTGPSNFLEFQNTDRPSTAGTSYDLWVLASSATGGNISGCVTDNAICVSAYGTFSLGSKPKWIKVQNTQAVTISGGANIYSSTSDVLLYAVALTASGAL